MNNGLALNNQDTVHKPTINWRQVGVFLGLTFAASYALDLVLWLTAGYGNNVPTAITLQARMLMPAFFAILLNLLIYRNSPIYFRNYRDRPRWFFYFFLLFTLTYLLLAALAIIIPTHSTTISAVSGSINILGLIFLVALRIFSGREAFAQARLVGGKIRDLSSTGAATAIISALSFSPITRASLRRIKTRSQGRYAAPGGFDRGTIQPPEQQSDIRAPGRYS